MRDDNRQHSVASSLSTNTGCNSFMHATNLLLKRKNKPSVVPMEQMRKLRPRELRDVPQLTQGVRGRAETELG